MSKQADAAATAPRNGRKESIAAAMGHALAGGAAVRASARGKGEGKGKGKAKEQISSALPWSCSTCTFLHEGRAAEFLACSLCGAVKPAECAGEDGGSGSRGDGRSEEAAALCKLADAKRELAKLSKQRGKAEVAAEKQRPNAAQSTKNTAAKSEETKRDEAEELEIAYAVTMSIKRMAANVKEAEATAAASVVDAATAAAAPASAAVPEGTAANTTAAAAPKSPSPADEAPAHSLLPLEVARKIAPLEPDSTNPAYPTIYGNRAEGDVIDIHFPQTGPIVEEIPFILCFDAPKEQRGMCYHWKGKFVQLDPPVPHPTDPALSTYYQTITLGRDNNQMKVVFYNRDNGKSGASYTGVFCFPTVSTSELLKTNGIHVPVGTVVSPATARDNAVAVGTELAAEEGRSTLREAAKQLTVAVQLSGNGSVWAQRAEVHLRANMLKEAVRDASVAVAMHSKSAAGWTTLATAQLQLQRYDACTSTCAAAAAAVAGSGGSAAATKALEGIGQRCAEEQRLSAAGASRWHKADSRALNCPEIPEVVGSVHALAMHLTSPFAASVDKYRAIFRWVTNNIAYDTVALKTGDYGDTSPEGILKTRMGVCAGSAKLFEALCHEANLEAWYVSGYSKGGSYKAGQAIKKPSHAWNVIRLEDGALVPLDSCWGAGHVAGMTFTREYEEYWWCTPPERFVLTHLPSDPQWSCLDETPSLSTFCKTIGLKGGFFSAGLDLVSHKEAVIRVQPKARLAVKFEQAAGQELFLLAHLKGEDGRGGKEWNCTCTFDSFKREHTVTVKAPQLRTPMTLQIFFSKERYGSFEFLMSYVVKKGDGNSTNPKSSKPSAPPASNPAPRGKSTPALGKNKKNQVAPVGAGANGARGSRKVDPLPTGWAEANDADGRTYYIHHGSQSTSWDDPRKLVDVVGDAEWTSLRNSGKVCVAMFYSQMCTVLLPKYEALARQGGYGDANQVVFAKVNLGDPSNLSLNNLKLGLEGAIPQFWVFPKEEGSAEVLKLRLAAPFRVLGRTGLKARANRICC